MQEPKNADLPSLDTLNTLLKDRYQQSSGFYDHIDAIHMTLYEYGDRYAVNYRVQHTNGRIIQEAWAIFDGDKLTQSQDLATRLRYSTSGEPRKLDVRSPPYMISKPIQEPVKQPSELETVVEEAA